MDLKNCWKELATRYENDLKQVETCWMEIESAYTTPARQYHNLDHLDYMVAFALEYKDRIMDLDTLLFSIYYHDIIYSIKHRDNEEKSAVLARQKLTTLSVPTHQVEVCSTQILATKNHRAGTDTDTNHLVDFDLAILGDTPEKYKEYARKIRKEYAVYPNFIYNRGRKKVLRHFLEMDRIFKTADFYERYEAQARVNISNELKGDLYKGSA